MGVLDKINELVCKVNSLWKSVIDIQQYIGVRNDVENTITGRLARLEGMIIDDVRATEWLADPEEWSSEDSTKVNNKQKEW